MLETNATGPSLPENMWGYGKRLGFVDDALRRAFPEVKRCALTVLDIGCGNGTQLAIPLASSGYQVTAVDPHERSIERGKALAPGVHYVHGEVTDLPSGRFAGVILSEVLEHLPAPEILLQAALGYLAADGVLIVTVPNGYGEFEIDRRAYRALRADKLVGRLYAALKGRPAEEFIGSSDDDSPHVQRFTLSRLRAMFAAHHLQVIEERGTSLASGPFVVHTLGRSKAFVRWNAAITDRLPLVMAAGWMFSLRAQPFTQPSAGSASLPGSF